ncbi:MAG TPA: MFS transporter, partial [Micromonosporaceae bacterium]|nr:MFS transporter [Micromonosporaceae bacterium]
VVALPAGAWVDRVRRRPILIATDIGSALLLASVPVAAAWHVLTVTQLVITGFLAGALSVTFDVAYPAFLPSVVPPGRLVDGNGLMEAGANAAQVAGPSLGGVLVQVVGAPATLLADAVSFVVSACALATIGVPESHASSMVSAERGPRASLRADIVAGLRYVVHGTTLRPLVTSVTVANFIFGGYAAVVLVFYARQLGLPAAAIGAIVAVAGVGGIIGSLVAGPLARRVGDARLLWISTMVTTPLLLLVPLGRPGGWLALPVIGVIGANAAIAAFNVCVRAALQRNVPAEMLGRVTASIRVFSRGSLPLGALVGGALASAATPRFALFAMLACFVAVPLLVWRSPISQARTLVDLATPTASAAPATS